MTIFQNSQWTVTKDRMASRKPAPDYKIPATRLLEKNRGHYDWPGHMAEKNWVSTPEFIEAYTAALKALHPDFEKGSLEKAIEEVRKEKA